jgi:hypothetical protein
MIIMIIIFRLGSIYKKLSRPINAINHSPSQYAKWGWCAAMTLRQYLVCCECRKVAQHCSMGLLLKDFHLYRY